MKILILYFFIFIFEKISKINSFDIKKNNNLNIIDKLKELEGVLLYYYLNDNKEQIFQTLEKINELDETRYERDKKIIDFWYYVDNEMNIYENKAPDDLPISDHAFIVLGHKLNDDGSLSNEGKGRCDVAYESAIKYPNSMIYVTGGGTSKYNKTITEGGQMYDYLINVKGLDSKRIIKETSAMDTVENAKNTFKKLIEGNIKSITIITSDYHVRRGTLLFYAESLIIAESIGNIPISIVKNVGFHTGRSTEGKLIEGYSLALIMDIKIILIIIEIIKTIIGFLIKL